jgi:hypothetical protein
LASPRCIKLKQLGEEIKIEEAVDKFALSFIHFAAFWGSDIPMCVPTLAL